MIVNLWGILQPARVMPFVMILVASGAEMREPSLSLQGALQGILSPVVIGAMLLYLLVKSWVIRNLQVIVLKVMFSSVRLINQKFFA